MQINYITKAFNAGNKIMLLEINWDATEIRIRQKGNFTIEVPPSDKFKVVQLNVLQYLEH